MDTDMAGMAAYERVAERIRAEVRAEVLKRGDKLPSHRQLAEKYGVALGTAQKAVQLLQVQGWLAASPSVGVFVQEPPSDAVPAPKLSEVAQELANLRQTVESLNDRVVDLESRS